MTLEEIKQAINAGKKVYWKNELYKVVKDRLNQWLIVCSPNQYAIGLTWRDGITLNGKPEDFYISE